MVLIDFKGYFQGQKVPIWIFIYLGQYLRNGACCDQCFYEVHTQIHIWSFNWPCDLWLNLKVKSRYQINVHILQGNNSCAWTCRPHRDMNHLISKPGRKFKVAESSSFLYCNYTMLMFGRLSLIIECGTYHSSGFLTNVWCPFYISELREETWSPFKHYQLSTCIV